MLGTSLFGIWKEEALDEQRIETFLDLYRQPVPAHIQKLEGQAKRDGVPVIRRGTRDVLRYLLKTRRPRHVLEIGTAIGYSSLFMKTCLPRTSRITTVEKVKMRIHEAKKNLAEYDPEGQIRLLEGEAADVLQTLAANGERFDFVFMDAAKGQYLNFFPHVMPLMNPGAVLVSDNIFHDGDVLQSRFAVTRRDRTIHERMREYLCVLTGHEQLETICLPVSDGMAVSAYCPEEGDS